MARDVSSSHDHAPHPGPGLHPPGVAGPRVPPLVDTRMQAAVVHNVADGTLFNVFTLVTEETGHHLYCVFQLMCAVSLQCLCASVETEQERRGLSHVSSYLCRVAGDPII